MIFDYELTTICEVVGEEAIHIRCLRDFEAAVDQMFAKLFAQGDGELLRDLCPYFGALWPSARILAGELARRGQAGLKGKRMLEVGCGLALPSLTAAKLGANVTASDCHPDVPHLLQENLDLNNISGLIYHQLDWQGESKTPALGAFDLVVGSDILYEKAQAKPLASFLNARLTSSGEVLITDPSRPYLQDFVTAMEDLSFRCQIETYPASCAGGDRDVFLLTFTRSLLA